MGNDHSSSITNKEIQLLEYSEGYISLFDMENMYLEDLEYFIYNYKIIHENKEKNRQERFKSIMEYVNKGLDTLFKLLSKLGGRT